MVSPTPYRISDIGAFASCAGVGGRRASNRNAVCAMPENLILAALSRLSPRFRSISAAGSTHRSQVEGSGFCGSRSRSAWSNLSLNVW